MDDEGLSISDDDEVQQSCIGYPPDYDCEEDDNDRICLPPDDDDDDDEDYGAYRYHYVQKAITQNIDNPVVVDDQGYYERLGIKCDKWNGGISTEELQGHIVAGLMARGETLSTGINANDLDLNMRDCTGLALENFLIFLDVSDAFRTRFSNDKSALLFEPQFKGIVSYSAADGNFKPALNGGVLPPCLQVLHEILLKTGVRSRERKEKAEIVKIDRMSDPVTRKRCMISCNMLLEMMNRICQAKCVSSVKWQDVQNAFAQMMTEEKGSIFRKYEPLLALKQLKSDHGINLNQSTCRILFGRGTISKALANDIYSKIRHEHDGTHLILSFHDPNDPGRDVYKKSDFDTIGALIAKQSRPPRPPRRYGGGPGADRQRREERERLEFEERKKTFRMPSISSVYVPSESHSDHNIFGGLKSKRNEEREEERPSRQEERAPHNIREERRPSPPRSFRDSSEDRGGYQEEEYPYRKFEPGSFGPVTNEPEVSDISDSGQEPANNYNDDVLSDSLSSDCERPVQQTEALFSDDEEAEQQKREEAKRHDQMRREMEEKRKKAIALRAEMEANQKGPFSTLGGKKMIGTHRGRFSQFSAPFCEPEAECEPEVPVFSETEGKKMAERQKKPEKNDEPKGPVILTPSKARWGVPVDAETVPEKDNRLQEYCVAAAAAEKFSTVSEEPRPPSTNVSGLSTFMERAVDDSIPSSRERKRGPPPTYSTVEMNFRNGPPPPPALGSTRHETTINRTNVGVQSNLVCDVNTAVCTDPSKLGGLREVFISYLSFHVYCNRSTEGIAVRTWSRISKGLDASLRAPELFMGKEWTEELERAIPNLCVVPIRGDLLFDWSDEPAGGASRRSSLHRF